MINTIIILLVLAFSAPDESAIKTDFCEGFEEGYKEGWCYNEGDDCLEPITPECPIPKITESSDSYKDGYNRGYTKGKKNKKREQ